MTTSLLADAFGHHVWATLTLFDSLADLTPEQMETSVAGTYGSIRETAQHLVGADCSYLFVIGGGTRPRIDEETMGLAELRAEMEANGASPRAQQLRGNVLRYSRIELVLLWVVVFMMVVKLGT